MPARRASISAPTAGWVQNVNIRQPAPDQAEVLVNWFPTARNAELRNGCAQAAILPNAVTQIMPYGSGKLVAADASNLYAITIGSLLTSPGGTNETADVSSLSNGDWSYVQFANSSDQYLCMVNGADGLYTYNGTSFVEQSISGMTTPDQIWTFGKRIFAVEPGTQSAWYLAANAIAGTFTEFPLQGVFQLGGSLLFGGRWSADSGEGYDDYCVFVTTEGEVAIYGGTDPSSDFAIQGVYRIGRPISKNGHFRSGGDLVILTEDGIVPLSAVTNRDKAALRQAAITFPIEDAWTDAALSRTSAFPFTVTLDRAHSRLIVSGGYEASDPFQFVANIQTGAWCQFKGWDVQCSCTLDGEFYFGDREGRVMRADVGGTDLGEPINATWLSRFNEFGDITTKEVTSVRFLGRSAIEGNIGLFANADYVIEIPEDVATTDDVTLLSGTWGNAVWGEATWGATRNRVPYTVWATVAALGTSIAVGAEVKSGNVGAWNLEISGLDLVFNEGNLI